MGLLDGLKGRLNKQDESGYYDDEEYLAEDYDDDGIPQTEVASTRSSSVFNDFTPLVSMSDVRSQELPRFSEQGSSVRAGVRAVDRGPSAATRYNTSTPQFKDSLPYVGDPAQSSFSAQDTGSLAAAEQPETRAYSAEDSGDPLLQRHSLSNTGDFSTTSPAYYASRSGVGHVRPAGQGRRTNTFREAVVVRPEAYSEAEQIALNLKRGNAVILVLTQTRAELAKRILDFSFGAAAATDGQVTSIGERIYALTRDHPLTQAEKELLQARGIL